MRYLINIFLVLTLSSNVWAVAQIDILSAESKNYFQGYTFPPPYEQITDAYLDLGENLSSKIVRISSGESELFRVKVQMESSLTIMNEGPHLDLINWKHCTTEWLEAKKISDSQFKLPVMEKIDPSCFPETTIPEIRNEVLKRGGERWANLIKDSASLNDYPMAIALSSVRIKVEKRAGEQWKTVTIIQFSIPMGC